MRRLKVALLVLVFALPVAADNKPGIGGMDPEQGGGCQECSFDYRTDVIACENSQGDPGWMDCVGGWLWLCDGYAGCWREPNCGRRCAIA